MFCLSQPNTAVYQSSWSRKRREEARACNKDPRKKCFRRNVMRQAQETPYPPRVPVTKLSRCDVTARNSLLMALLKTLSKDDILAMVHFVLSYVEKDYTINLVMKFLRKLPSKDVSNTLRTLFRNLCEPILVETLDSSSPDFKLGKFLPKLSCMLRIVSKDNNVKILCEILKYFPLNQSVLLVHKFLVSLPDHDPIISTNKILSFVTNKLDNSKDSSSVLNFPINNRRTPLTSSPKHSMEEREISISPLEWSSVQDKFFSPDKHIEVSPGRDSGNWTSTASDRSIGVQGSVTGYEKQNPISGHEMASKFETLKQKMNRLDVLLQRIENIEMEEDASISIIE